MTFAAKLLMVITTAGAVPWGRFATVFFLHSGVSASRLGLLRVVGLVGKTLAYPAWGMFADMIRDVRLALLASIVLSSASLVLFRSSYVLSTFGALFLVKLLRSLLNAVWPLTEAMALKLIAGGKEGYGKQRLWCAISWGLASFVVGNCIDRFGVTAIFELTWGISLATVILVMLFIPKPSADAALNHGKKKVSGLSVKDLIQYSKDFISSGENSQFYITMFVYGFVFSLSEVVLMIAMEKDFRASKTLQGLAITASTVIEVPVFYYSDSLLKSYSVSKMFLVAHSTMAFRLLAYSMVPLSAPWMIVVIQLCHGLCFSLMWVAAVSFASQRAPKGMEATAQTMLSNVWVLGNGLGAAFWTNVYERAGSFRFVFLVGVLVLATLISWSHWKGPIGTISKSKREPDTKRKNIELVSSV